MIAKNCDVFLTKKVPDGIDLFAARLVYPYNCLDIYYEIRFFSSWNVIMLSICINFILSLFFTDH